MPVRKSREEPETWFGRANSARSVSAQVRAPVPKPLIFTAGKPEASYA